MSADTGARERPTKPLFRDRIRAALSHDPERLADFDALCQWEDELLDFTTDLVTRTDAAGVGAPPDEELALATRIGSRAMTERDEAQAALKQIEFQAEAFLADRLSPSMSMIRIRDRAHAALAGVGEARPAEPAASVAETMKGQLP